MEINDAHKQQKECLENFDKQLFTYTGQVAWFLPALFAFFGIGLGAIPFSSYDNTDISSIAYMIYVSCAMTYYVLHPYLWCNGFGDKKQSKSDSIFGILKTLPVSKEVFVVTRMKYLFRYIWKVTAIVMMIQVVISLISKNFFVGNYLFVLLVFMGIPSVFGYMVLKIHTKAN